MGSSQAPLHQGAAGLNVAIDGDHRLNLDGANRDAGLHASKRMAFEAGLEILGTAESVSFTGREYAGVLSTGQ